MTNKKKKSISISFWRKIGYLSQTWNPQKYSKMGALISKM
jgi:hypothetical protein